MRVLVAIVGLVVGACSSSDESTASNESGGTGGSSAGAGGSGGAADSGWSSGGGAGTAGASGLGGAGGAAGASGTAGAGGAAGSTGAGGGAGSGGCIQQVVDEKIAGSVANDASVGYQAWETPGNAALSDDLRATSPGLPATRVTHRLLATGFGFQIPANATILGLQVIVERSQTGNGSAKDDAIRVLKGGAPVPDNPIKTATWPATDTEATYGAITSSWGTTWSPADFTATGFGVWVRAQNAHATANVNPRVDAIKARVHYVFDACTP